MDDACSLRSLGSGLECPGTVLIGTGGEEGPQTQGGIGFTDQGVHAAFLQAHLREELRPVIGAVHGGDLSLNLAADGRHGATALCGNLLDRLHVIIVLTDRVLVDVADVDDGLHRDQMQIGYHGPLILIRNDCPGALALSETGKQFLIERDDRQKLLGVVHLGKLGILLVSLVHRVIVGKGKLDVYGLDVACGVDPVVDVDDVRVLEAPHDMRDDTHFPDVGQELVAQALSLGSTCHETCDINELGHCRNHLCRRNDADDPVQPRIGDVHPADVRLDCAERIVGSLGRSAGQGRENGGLSHIRKSYDTAVKSHMTLHKEYKQILSSFY